MLSDCVHLSFNPPQANGADIRGGTWFETGAEMLNGGTLNYFAVPWGIVSNPLPLFVVIAIEAGLMGAVELYRRNGTGPAGYSPGIGKFESSGGCGLGLRGVLTQWLHGD
jgi:light-harvesting complex II chlorophyll a/b binding protein 5